MNAVKGTWPREAPCVKSLIVESKGRDAGFSFYSRRETERLPESKGFKALLLVLRHRGQVQGPEKGL